jgi:hypothetical protein
LTKLGTSLSQFLAALAIALSVAASPHQTSAQQKQSIAKDSKPAATEKNAAQVELLETRYRFETNGDSRKEVHARVRINNELGARQFARLNFDFNRSFQSVEIPFVRVTHASGGTADILPSAITDYPNPAVVDYPAYHEVRVKSVRILGLQPDDLLEYRVITITAHHPLAPDFWLDHTFDRSGVASREIFELDLPAALKINLRINPETPPQAPPATQGGDARNVYRWDRKAPARSAVNEDSDANKPDVSFSTFQSWDQFSKRLAPLLFPMKEEVVAMREKAFRISQGIVDGQIGKYYEFVSQKIRTVDLPLDAMGYRSRRPEEILQSGYASAEDKFRLFATLSGIAQAGFVTNSAESRAEAVPSPACFHYLLTLAPQVGSTHWLDLNAEVAPEGMIPTQFRGKPVFTIDWSIAEPERSQWQRLDVVHTRPYQGSQSVSVKASIDAEGKLLAKVHYAMRGENELMLRVAFHKTEREKWKDVAQMLALSDGFRGQIVNVTASDPYATKEPFTVEYEISQPKFVDWSKQTVRVPAILPLAGLPDPPSADQIEAKKPIELGTPLAVDLEAIVELPAGAAAQAPIGTTVNRDYATFTSKYSVQGNTLRASRSLHFLSSELPASRATDFNAFLHAVQSDQTQVFTVTAAPQKQKSPQRSFFGARFARRYLISMTSFSLAALKSSIFFVSAWETFSSSSSARFCSSWLIFLSFSSLSIASLMSRRMLRTAVR